MEAFISDALTTAMPYLVLYNCIMLYLLTRKVKRFEGALARYEDRDRAKLERDTMEAMTLLRTGKIEEAKTIAERIVHS